MPPERPWYSQYAPELLTLLGAALQPLRVGARRDIYGRQQGGITPFAPLMYLGPMLAQRQQQEDVGELNKFLSSMGEQKRNVTVNVPPPDLSNYKIEPGGEPSAAPLRGSFGPLGVDYTSPATQAEFEQAFTKLPSNISGQMRPGQFYDLMRSLPGRAKTPQEAQRIYDIMAARMGTGAPEATTSVLSKSGDPWENMLAMMKATAPTTEAREPGRTYEKQDVFGNVISKETTPESSSQQLAGEQLKQLKTQDQRNAAFREGMTRLNPSSPIYLEQLMSLAARTGVDDPQHAIANALSTMNTTDALRHRKVLEGFEQQKLGLEAQRLQAENKRLEKATGGGAVTPGTKEAEAALARIRDDARQRVEGLFRVQGPLGAFIDFRRLDPDPEKARTKLETLINQTEEQMIRDLEARGIRLRISQSHEVKMAQQPDPTMVRDARVALTRERPPSQFKGKRARDPETGLNFQSDGTKWDLIVE